MRLLRRKLAVFAVPRPAHENDIAFSALLLERRVAVVRRTEAQLAAFRCAEIEPRHITLEQLEPNDCRYPFGDGPFTFCGLMNVEGRSYCPEHFKLSTAKERSNSEAVTEARARRMRGINFRKALLEVRP